MKLTSDAEDLSLESVCTRSKRRRKKPARFACTPTRKTSAGVSSGFTSGDSSDSAGSLERVRRQRPEVLRSGSVLFGEELNALIF